MAESMSAIEAVDHFLASVDPDKARDERPEIDRFVASIGADGKVACAQASRDEALVRDETLASFTGEEHIWILRPNKRRVGGPATP